MILYKIELKTEVTCVNELLFFLQILLSLLFTLGALRLGKEALITNSAFQALFANLFLLKQIGLFGLEVTASDGFAVGCLLSLNLLREFYGRESADKSIQISFFCLLFFALFSQLHLFYEPSRGDTAHGVYVALFSPAPRLFLSSLFTFWLVQRFDLWLFEKLSGSFVWKNGVCLMLSLALDTLVFTFLGLYGLVPSLGNILLFSFCVKALSLATFLPFTRGLKSAPV